MSRLCGLFQVLVPESERAEHESAKAQGFSCCRGPPQAALRAQELEERRALNEEIRRQRAVRTVGLRSSVGREGSEGTSAMLESGSAVVAIYGVVVSYFWLHRISKGVKEAGAA